MSYETFRADFLSRLSDLAFPPDLISQLLPLLDGMSDAYDFSPKSTGLIVADGLPDVVRLYIASKIIQQGVFWKSYVQ